MPVAIAVNAIPVESLYRLDGQDIFETRVSSNDYEGFASLPKVVTLNGKYFTKTGWNSDSGFVCYKAGKLIATPI